MKLVGQKRLEGMLIIGWEEQHIMRHMFAEIFQSSTKQMFAPKILHEIKLSFHATVSSENFVQIT